MSFRKCVTRDAPEKKIPGQSTRSKVMWYKSILWRLVHIQTWLVAPVAPVQLILRMLNALQSAIVQKISSVTWFTARSATTVLTARLICYSREQVRYWVVAINKDQFYLKILFLISAYDKQHLLSLPLGVFEPQDLHIKMTVCPRHRELFGTRWRCNRSRCTVPDRVAVHKGTPKAQCGLKKMISAYILRATKVFVPLGSRKYFFIKCYYFSQRQSRSQLTITSWLLFLAQRRRRRGR